MTVVFSIVIAILVLVGGCTLIGMAAWRYGNKFEAQGQQIVAETEAIRNIIYEKNPNFALAEGKDKEIIRRLERIRRLV